MTSSLITFWHALPSGFTALIFADANRFFCSVVCCAVYRVGCLKCFQDGKQSSFSSLPSLPGRFSFFSRDKKRMQASQKNVHFQDTFGEWSNSNKDDSYTEQGQEALQHLWLKPWGVQFTTVDLDSLVTRSFCKQMRQLVTFLCLAHLSGCVSDLLFKRDPLLFTWGLLAENRIQVL